MKKTLCIDFDGVIHSYESGWQKDAEIPEAAIPDPPVPGAISWLVGMSHYYKLAIYSTRSSHPEGRKAIQAWIEEHVFDYLDENSDEFKRVMESITFPDSKPPAIITLDDRAICFRGTFPSRQEIENFRPWNT